MGDSCFFGTTSLVLSVCSSGAPQTAVTSLFTGPYLISEVHVLCAIVLCNPQFDNVLYEKTSFFMFQSGCQLISFHVPGLWDTVEELGYGFFLCRILQTSALPYFTSSLG